MTQAIHKMNGRIRIKSDKFNDALFSNQVYLNMIKNKGIENVNINAKNLCATIHYNPDILSLQKIQALISAQNLSLPANFSLSAIEVLPDSNAKTPATKLAEAKINSATNKNKNLVSNQSFDKSKDIALNLAKVFGSTWVKTALKETLDMAFKASGKTAFARKIF